MTQYSSLDVFPVFRESSHCFWVCSMRSAVWQFSSITASSNTIWS